MEEPSNAEARGLDDRLYELWRQHGLIYVLIDRYLSDPMAERLEQIPLQRRPATLALRDPIFADSPSRSPALVVLDFHRDGDADLLSFSAQLAWEEAGSNRARHICGWLFSDAPPDRIVSALSRRLDALYPKGKSIYLRYFDPAVMPPLHNLLGEQASSALLAPVETWCAVGRHRQWLRFDGIKPAQTPSAVRANEAMAASIDRIAIINSAASIAGGLGAFVHHDRDAELDAELQRAMTLGLSEPEQQAQFAALSLTFDSRFSLHPQLHQWLDAARQSGLPLLELVTPHIASPEPAP